VIELLSHLGGAVMLIGVVLMAAPVIRLGHRAYVPMFELGLGLFLIGLIAALAGAIGWIIGGGFVLSLFRYPLPGA
jgi:hypothetical protein